VAFVPNGEAGLPQDVQLRHAPGPEIERGGGEVLKAQYCGYRGDFSGICLRKLHIHGILPTVNRSPRGGQNAKTPEVFQ
jgi:hypothetical protein